MSNSLQQQPDNSPVDHEAESAVIGLAFSDYEFFSQLNAAGVNEKWFGASEAQTLWGIFNELYQPPAMEVYRYGVEKIAEARYQDEPKKRMAVMAFLEQAVLSNVPASHLERHYKRLLSAYQTRLESLGARQWLSLIADRSMATEARLVELEKTITEIRRAATPFEVLDAARLAKERHDWYQDRLDGKPGVTKLPYELDSLNYATKGGMGMGELTWWLAEPGRGKTALLQREAYYQAVYQNSPVLYITLEMNRAHWIDRVIQQETGISSVDLDAGNFHYFSDAVFSKLGKFGASKLYLIDDALASLDTIKRAAEYVKRQAGDLKVIYVDYAQIIKEPTISDRYSRYLYISEQLAALAKQLNCHIHGILRENKAGDPDGAKAFEYDCDNFVKLENDNTQEKDPQKRSGPAIAHFVKQRYGDSGRPAEIYWNNTWARYTDPDRVLPVVENRRNPFN